MRLLSSKHSPHSHVSPIGLWLGLLVSGVLGVVAFVVYTARLNWKLSAEEVSKFTTGEQFSQKNPNDRSLSNELNTI